VINLDYSVSFDSPDINDNTNDNAILFDGADLSICQVFSMVYLASNHNGSLISLINLEMRY